ncbi:glucose-1-phosphate cytidylyltransferase [Flavobacterium psychroterrae]|jgi:glucose-1-phosphate cytidylyltransferase|uniref:Glucose-1-phosphate cytidylyltransferase n=1 Tax=Flavobacterium psychroterrae TaxID=2133767 RepID=A0ABS5PCA3_9FLAO|nr:glucose-1-phosphate cytidylyltransferase [Flavobacterium psychroterrae]MBS7231934.1 glucose-1-phosphate cytidylyltransferase [Flavobacterium psychroterrae]
MKVVIFAGGFGTRLMEETEARPKPMVEIGGKPILWHILKMFEQHGYDEFIICLGYKATFIKEYFYNYYLHNSDVTIELANNNINVHYSETESFKVTLIDTGLYTNTAGRLKRIQKYVKDETFMLTYGDGVADVDLSALLKFHKSHGRLATLTSVQVPGRFGNLEINSQGEVDSFVEKPAGDGMWINGGFFVLEPGIFKYLEGDVEDVQWEKEPLGAIAQDQQLAAYKHEGFWKCMDALRDRVELEAMWSSGNAKWKTW